MIEIQGTYEDVLSAMAAGKKAILRGNTLIVGTDVGMPIGVVDTPPSSYITVFQPFHVVNIHIHNTVFRVRWMSALSKWQNITNLFADYGSDPDPVMVDNIAKFKGPVVYDAITPYPFINDPDFMVMYEIRNNRMYIHCFVYKWDREVMRRLRSAVIQLQTDHPFDNYIYSIKPNVEYALGEDTTFKFAKLAGYKFLETVMLADGYEHDIYKRTPNDIGFISKHV